jgi:hypothetical protein
MDKEYKFGRMFLILKRDDEGFGLGKDPTGYVKIEVTEGKGKFFAHIENLNDKQEKAVFKLYLIKCSKEQFNPVCVGILPLKEGKGELTWRFDASNVDSTGISIDKFNIVAVAATGGQKRTGMSFPLVAYRGIEVLWKDKLKETLYPKNFSDYQNSGNIDSPIIDNKTKASQYKEVEAENAEVENIGTENVVPQNIEAENIPTNDFHIDLTGEKDFGGEKSNFDISVDETSTPPANELEEENIHIEVGEDKHEGMNDKYIHQGNSAGKDNQPCSNVNGCTNCINNRFNKLNFDAMSNGIDTNKLKELFNKDFEAANPFKNGCRIYKWWNVNNPVVLNNIFYQCNLRNPFLFNPKVLFAYYKHRNLIVGICNDISSDKEYIVLGVPGNYSSEQRPLGVFCRWAQEEGVEPKNGAFGFWLVYIDPNTGKIIG